MKTRLEENVCKNVDYYYKRSTFRIKTEPVNDGTNLNKV